MNDATTPELLLIDKPAGMTSHDVVDVLRRQYKTRRVGHGGTLDPFATGLLLIGIGPGTKKLTGLVGLDKEYLATVRLGATTNTYDVEGIVQETTPPPLPPSAEALEHALAQFRGGYEQYAPLFSAKKVGGKKLYDLARAGIATEDLRPKKQVDIPILEVLRYQYPELELRVACSSGTYIRSLADDLGRVLGVGGYLTALRRTRIGPYRIEEALPLPPFTDRRPSDTLPS